jgi:hypothetical protein
MLPITSLNQAARCRSSISLLLAVLMLCGGSQLADSWSQSPLPPLPENPQTSFAPNAAPETSLPSAPTLGTVPNQNLPILHHQVAGQVLGSSQILGGTSCSANSSHLMSSVALSNGMQQIVLVEPAKQTMAVYHIDPIRGEIHLKSVRKIDADFAIEEFNATDPTPTAIRRNTRLQINR